jgi:hypothetical protein
LISSSKVIIRQKVKVDVGYGINYDRANEKQGERGVKVFKDCEESADLS